MERNFCVAKYARKDVIEVVGYAACQCPYGLHLLRLPQVFFKLNLLGHVAFDGNKPFYVAIRGDNG